MVEIKVNSLPPIQELPQADLQKLSLKKSIYIKQPVLDVYHSPSKDQNPVSKNTGKKRFFSRLLHHSHADVRRPVEYVSIGLVVPQGQFTVYTRSCIEKVVGATAIKAVTEEVAQYFDHQTLLRAKLLFDKLAEGRLLHEFGNLCKRVANWQRDPVDLRVLVRKEVGIGYVMITHVYY
jgi:hypothetical protein